MAKKYKDRDWLRRKYWDEGLSTTEIAEICDVTSMTIWRWMERHNIERRDKSEALSGERNPMHGGLSEEHRQAISDGQKDKRRPESFIEKASEWMSGENHWNWQGGKTREQKRLRNTKEYEDWR